MALSSLCVLPALPCPALVQEIKSKLHTHTHTVDTRLLYMGDTMLKQRGASFGIFFCLARPSAAAAVVEDV